jgi:cyclic pyranopterin phosphate synthase
MSKLSHTDANGAARMVDISSKPVSVRVATAEAIVEMSPETLALIVEGRAPKGDAIAAARIAGIMAAKKTHELIPLCHPLALSSVEMRFEPDAASGRLRIESEVKVNGNTGVEMEALTAVTIGALTVYDMIKAVERGVTIGMVRLLSKDGGASGLYRRTPADHER